LKFSNGSDVVNEAYLFIVSILLVSAMAVSVIMVVSVDMFVESEAEPSDFFELQAATDKDKTRAKKPNLNEFFIMVFFKVSLVIINTRGGKK
jgi:hypothetical protein